MVPFILQEDYFVGTLLLRLQYILTRTDLAD